MKIGKRRFSVHQRGGNSISGLIVKNALRQQRENQIGSNAFKNVGRRVFKALMGKTVRSIVKNKVLP